MDEKNVNMTREKYEELVAARFSIDLIGSSLGRYGPDDKVVLAVCKQFGYEWKEEEDA